jgi:hypothetical protein
MSRATWKATERLVARQLGGERVPVTGRTRGSAPDIEHSVWAVEVKHRQKLPDWLKDAMSQARASVRGNKIPLVVLHEHGRHSSLAVLRLSDLVELCGEIEEDR